MVLTSIIVCCIIGNFFGIFGASSFIFSYKILPEIRNRSRLFILTLSICNIICEISGLLPGYKNTHLCTAQCFLINWIFIACFCWIFMISLIYYLQICRNFDIENSPKFYWFSNLFVQLFSLLHGILAVTLGKPKSGASYWCFISDKNVEIFHYSTIWFFLISTLILYSLVVHKIRKDKDINYPKSFQIKMLTLATLYIITELSLFIKKMTQIFKKDYSPNEFVDAFEAFFTPLLGFWDFVFFVVGDKFVRALLIRKFKKKKSQDVIELNQGLISFEN
ncbi:g protein-coupled receptor [Anaeramoeba ignava]|uniref:G protein-coupled receptor n=1 Tax=Anaeramoeba ignava TaxID=1746090 RepID=A0A9Q0LC59_ANAIG|nr:g protein-coupled receptor [Anaeramoeba ignava]